MCQEVADFSKATHWFCTADSCDEVSYGRVYAFCVSGFPT